MKLRRSAPKGPPDWLRRRWRELTTYDIWNVGIAALDAPLRAIEDLRIDHVRWLPEQPPLEYAADPFPYRYDGRDWLLVERYSHAKGVRGHISRFGPIDDLHPAFAAAIAPACHVSYPFTFEADGRIYCAPEMSRERGCVIYGLEADGGWRPVCRVLADRSIVDPTIFRFGGRWWLFGTGPPPAHNTTLHAFFADAITGPWRPHAGNPVKVDPGSSRPAGRPFAIGGRVFRPAQDCRSTYGGAVAVMEILELTPSRFVEAHAHRLEPNAAWPYPDGLHHLVVDGTRVYFDAKRRRRDYALWLKVRVTGR